MPVTWQNAARHCAAFGSAERCCPAKIRSCWVDRRFGVKPQLTGDRLSESACRPGLDPGSFRLAMLHSNPAVTSDCDLGGSRRLAADDSAMCPECARSRMGCASGRLTL